MHEREFAPLHRAAHDRLERLAEGALPRDVGADVRNVVGPASLGDDLALAHLEVERGVVVAVVEEARHRLAVGAATAGEHLVPRVGDRAQLGEKPQVGQVAGGDHGVGLLRVEEPERVLEIRVVVVVADVNVGDQANADGAGRRPYRFAR